MLSAEIGKRRPAFELDVAFQVEPGQTLALVGESGSGKSTVLRLIAGLESPDRGHITWGDTRWFDGGRGLTLPAWRRPVGLVTQDYALFPHLTLFENVAFGLRAMGRPGAEVRSRVDRELGRLGLSELAGRRPHQVSGGQQQRAALARALVLEPAVLLLDEPLSALDPATRRQVRSELGSILRGLRSASVYVTHSPVEALVFGDQVAVLAAGRIAQRGTRDDLLAHPRSAFVAEFMGVNLFQGKVVSREPGGLARVATGDGELVVPDLPGETEVFLSVLPREITLSTVPPEGSAQNVFAGRIVEVVPEPPRGERVRVLVRSRPPLVAEVTRQAVERLGLAEGVEVHASFKATGVMPYT